MTQERQKERNDKRIHKMEKERQRKKGQREKAREKGEIVWREKGEKETRVLGRP